MTEAEWESCHDPVPMLAFLGERLGLRKRRLFAVACARRVEMRRLLKYPASVEGINAAERFANGDLSEEDLAEYEQAARQASARCVREARGMWAMGPAALTARAAWVAVWAACAAENTCDASPTVATPGSVTPGSLEAGFQGCLAARTAQVASWAITVADEITDDTDNAPDTETALFFSFLGGPKTTTQRIEQAVRDGVETCETLIQAHMLKNIVGNPFKPGVFNPKWRTPEVEKVAQTIAQEKSWGDLPILGDALEDAGCTDGALLQHLHDPSNHVAGSWGLDLVLQHGNRIEPGPFQGAWRTEHILEMATKLSRTTANLHQFAALADALEKIGCNDHILLTRLRDKKNPTEALRCLAVILGA